MEGVASGSLNFISGLLVATLSKWPPSVIPVGVLVGNTILVSLIISATASATGGHINSIVTMATAFSGLCHPVRAIVYVSCQIVGGVLGGALLRVALGKKVSGEIHNASCWIEPGGDVDVWQATLIEFTSAFILLSVLFLFSYHNRLYPSPFIPGSWLTGWDWTPVKLDYLAQNTDQCWWDYLSVYCKPRSLPPSYMGGWSRSRWLTRF